MVTLNIVSFLAFSFCFVKFNYIVTANQEFHEELYLKPLSSHYVYAYFQFTTIWNTSLQEDTFEHCDLFPRWIGELIGRHNVENLHLSLTKGLWSHRLWGYPFVQAPPGAEITATFLNPETVDKDWVRLCGGLSGLVCASLNFIDLATSWSPGNLSLTRYSALPRETVCTENLTPFLKLIPCNLVGLSSLLNSDQVYNTIYHSLGIHFRKLPNGGIELKQTVSLVYDQVVLGPSFNRDTQHWSIQRLFHRGIVSLCPLAKSSMVYLDVTFNKTYGGVSVIPKDIGKEAKIVRGGAVTHLLVFNMSQHHTMNIEMTSNRVPQPSAPMLYASTFITGSGQEFGGLTTTIYNNHFKDIVVKFSQHVPWFVPIYYHTVKVEDNVRGQVPVLSKLFSIGKDRERGYSLEMNLSLAGKSVTTISIDMDYAFLKWQEYPPDANHGFYLPAASVEAFIPSAYNYTAIPPEESIISSMLVTGKLLSRIDGYPVRITTEVLILTLPTPDFSMPYNVICLACTVVALAFGPLHNITTKKFVISDEKEPKFGIFDIFIEKLACLRRRRTTNQEPSTSAETNADNAESKKDR